jgi:hypothetical protein
MTLEQLGAGIDFVSDTPPANAADGDTFLDTSLSPPQVKVFDASIGSFVRPQTAQNLDQPVSNAGANLRFRGGFQVALASFAGPPFNIDGNPPAASGLAFNDDGTLMNVVGVNNQTVFQFALSTPFDIGTASTTGTSFDVSGQASAPEGLAFNNDGTLMFVPDASSRSVFQYSLSTPFDIGTASFTTSYTVDPEPSFPTGIAFSNDGSSLFVVGSNDTTVYQHALSTPFDIGTASFNGSSFSTSGQLSEQTGVTFNDDGTLLYVIGSRNDSVFQYSLSTPFDIDTALFTGSSFNTAPQAPVPADVSFNNDGTLMYVIASSDDSINQYLVGTVGPK